MARRSLRHAVATTTSLVLLAAGVDALKGLRRSGDAILVKGSRSVGLEVVAEALLEESA